MYVRTVRTCTYRPGQVLLMPIVFFNFFYSNESRFIVMCSYDRFFWFENEYLYRLLLFHTRTLTYTHTHTHTNRSPIIMYGTNYKNRNIRLYENIFRGQLRKENRKRVIFCTEKKNPPVVVCCIVALVRQLNSFVLIY